VAVQTLKNVWDSDVLLHCFSTKGSPTNPWSLCIRSWVLSLHAL